MVTQVLTCDCRPSLRESSNLRIAAETKHWIRETGLVSRHSNMRPSSNLRREASFSRMATQGSLRLVHTPADLRPDQHCSRNLIGSNTSKMRLRSLKRMLQCSFGARLWWNWQTRYFEVVVPQGVQVQILLSAPISSLASGALTSTLSRSIHSHVGLPHWCASYWNP